MFHRPNIGAVIEFAGHESMPTAMPRQKYNIPVAELTCQKLVRWSPERGLYGGPFLSSESFNFIQPTATNDTNFIHVRKPLSHGTKETK